MSIHPTTLDRWFTPKALDSLQKSRLKRFTKEMSITEPEIMAVMTLITNATMHPEQDGDAKLAEAIQRIMNLGRALVEAIDRSLPDESPDKNEAIRHIKYGLCAGLRDVLHRRRTIFAPYLDAPANRNPGDPPLPHADASFLSVEITPCLDAYRRAFLIVKTLIEEG